jgi:hypothetical protein
LGVTKNATDARRVALTGSSMTAIGIVAPSPSVNIGSVFHKGKP